MEYAIVNNNGVYIRLNNGQPVACTKKTRDTFQKQKAENILEHLPKSMRRLHFKLECIPDIKIQTPVERIVEATKTSIKGNDGYEVSESVRSWIDKFGECERILNDAAQRYKELEFELKQADEELIDILHEVELESQLISTEVGYSIREFVPIEKIDEILRMRWSLYIM